MSQDTIQRASQGATVRSAGSRPLVYIFQTTQMLKMLTKLFPRYQWKANWLHSKVKNNSPEPFRLGINLSYTGQPAGSRSEHCWEIKLDPNWYELPPKFDDDVSLGSDGTCRWNNFFFRSPAEAAVAKALESEGVLFFPNAKCRIRNQDGATETKEADFMVFHKGIARILEVDGNAYHQGRSEDYRRDRMFDKHGISSTRFTAAECLDDAKKVVKEFLELF